MNHAETLRNLAKYGCIAETEAAACEAGAEAWEREQWRPVETAPFWDEVLMRWPGTVLIGYRADNNIFHEQHSHRIINPTHWRPLPPGPDHSGGNNGMMPDHIPGAGKMVDEVHGNQAQKPDVNESDFVDTEEPEEKEATP